MLQRNLVCFWSKSLGIIYYVIRKGGGEQDNLNRLGQKTMSALITYRMVSEQSSLLDTDTLIPKPLLFQHIIGLVED